MVGVVLLAANLRPAVASVGPVLGVVQRGLGLSGAQTAVLTTLPVLCFGAFAPLGPRLGRRFGLERSLGLVLVAIAAGLALRVGPDAASLYAGTALAAAAIAVGNVLVPVLVKRDFPDRTGVMMGVYATALTAAAAVAAGTTVPLGGLLGGGWRPALGSWALLAVLAFLLWLPQLGAATRTAAVAAGALRALLHDRLAWQVTVFFGLQSLSFYAVLSWLPSILTSAGYSATAAGLLLSVSAIIQAPVSLVVPTLATRWPDQGPLAAGAALISALGLLGLLLAPRPLGPLWAVLLGLGQGASFPLALTLIVLRTRTSTDAARLSAMAQTGGYLIAALGPLLAGALHALTGGWSWSLAALLVLLGPQALAGVRVGRGGYVAGTADPP